MDGRVLVAYASAHGSTREIAERITERIGEQGWDADCRPVAEIDDVERYGAVVLGSAIHDRAWLPVAVRFVVANVVPLAARPVWLFSVGMPDAVARPLRGLARSEGEHVVAPFLAALHPQDVRLFSGVAPRSVFPPLSRVVLRLMGGHYGDLRDWQAIESWADAITARLPHGAPA